MAPSFLRCCFDIVCISLFLLMVAAVADAVAHSPSIVW